MKKIFVFLLFGQMAFCQWKNLGFTGPSPSIIKQTDKNILVGTAKGLFLFNGDWSQVLYGKKITSLAPNGSETFVGTDDGLYLMNTDAIRKIADGNINSILIQGDSLFYGGKYGLFESKDKGKNWKHLYLEEVLDIAFADKLIIATRSGCYKFDKGWKRIFASRSDEEDDEKEICLNIASIKERIFFSEAARLFVTEDYGVSWDRVWLPSSCIRQLILMPDSLYIIQEKGIYKLKEDGLTKLSALPYKIIDADFGSSLLVATNGGVFKLGNETNKTSNKQDEPDYLSVQQMAIRYAEVQPEKIAGWRKRARYKAVFPDLSLSYFNTINYSVTKDYVVGPKDWSLSLSWDLGNLIYSSDQTTIDSRSKLMVDLRNDILDEVNRIYFERKRLLAELMLEKDESKKLNKELLIEELTARLDGFTGGGFSLARRPIAK
ncbi:MAG: hypothetical protein QME07_00290 [bacterium]|nr:hypothetical protein [bacterium]